MRENRSECGPAWETPRSARRCRERPAWGGGEGHLALIRGWKSQSLGFIEVSSCICMPGIQFVVLQLCPAVLGCWGMLLNVSVSPISNCLGPTKTFFIDH